MGVAQEKVCIGLIVLEENALCLYQYSKLIRSDFVLVAKNIKFIF